MTAVAQQLSNRKRTRLVNGIAVIAPWLVWPARTAGYKLKGSAHDRKSAPRRASPFRSRGATALHRPTAQTLALVGGSVYASPDAAPLADAVVVTSNGVITAIGSRSEVQIPADARIIDCTGKTVVAGFWNSHVHFTQAVWKNAGTAPAAPLQEHMQEMLTRWGFTSVWDLGSDPSDTLPLRRRVNAGEVPGPDIHLAGSIFPKGGHPVYLPPEMQLPEAATPDEAAQLTRSYLRLGSRRHEAVHRRLQGRKQPRREHGRRPSPRRRSMWRMPRASRCSLIRRT